MASLFIISTRQKERYIPTIGNTFSLAARLIVTVLKAQRKLNPDFKQYISIASLLGRIGISSIILFIIYLLFGPPRTVELEMINMFLYLIAMPTILIVATIAACFLIGLPIRLIPRLYNWWISRPIIAFAGIAIGVFLLILSYNSHFTYAKVTHINEEEITSEIPNQWLVSIGWCVTSFSLIHFYPKSLKTFMMSKIGNRP